MGLFSQISDYFIKARSRTIETQLRRSRPCHRCARDYSMTDFGQNDEEIRNIISYLHKYPLASISKLEKDIKRVAAIGHVSGKCMGIVGIDNSIIVARKLRFCPECVGPSLDDDIKLFAEREGL